MSEKKEAKQKRKEEVRARALEEGITEEVEIPKGMQASLEGQTLKVKGPKGETEKKFSNKDVDITIEKDNVLLKTKNRKKKVKSAVYTMSSLVSNLFKGVEKGYKYELEIVYSHFPMNVAVKDNRIQINNFLGRKQPNYSILVGSTKAEIKGNHITLTGINKEHVGQSAANLEKATRVTGKDRRVYQDGIYIIKKNAEE